MFLKNHVSFNLSISRGPFHKAGFLKWALKGFGADVDGFSIIADDLCDCLSVHNLLDAYVSVLHVV